MLDKIPEVKVVEFEKEFLSMMNNQHAEILERLEKGEYNDEITGVLTEVATDIAKNYNSK